MYVWLVIDLFLVPDDPSQKNPDQDKEHIDNGRKAGHKQKPVVKIKIDGREGVKEEDKYKNAKTDTQVQTCILFDKEQQSRQFSIHQINQLCLKYTGHVYDSKIHIFKNWRFAI